ncbi:hypothetical protein ACFYW8_35090 [Streptomyces sp. NPDC002742]|uniref:hypothetical protein n=1 Tax=Streptomyces sp. NPDC002742 TaxID=3364663 RepID=UPI00367E227A
MLGSLPLDRRTRAAVRPLLAAHPTTATDVLRPRELEELPDGFACTLRRVLPQAGPGPLLAALGRLRVRHLPGERRVFFPRGRVTRPSTLDDTRGAPPAEAVTDGVRALLGAEAVRRVSSAPRFDLAALDTGLAGPAIPSVERAPAKVLVPVPRGSSRPLPEGEVLRLFPRSTQPAKVRVELGLSVAPYDEGRTFVGVCDCTRRPARTRSRWSGRRSQAKSGDGLWHYVRGEEDGRGLRRPGTRCGPSGAAAAGRGPGRTRRRGGAKRYVPLALVHGVAPQGASGSVYRLPPGPVDGCGLTALTAGGDLVRAPGRARRRRAALGRPRQRRARRTRSRGPCRGGPVTGSRGRRIGEAAGRSVSRGPYPH